ncbi:MAG: DUF4368 domain-containing protein [Lachnospiraceae bacterium]|nr:DUF4368 domain-containing protein [Lachnospiraceae bacterium]
MHKFIEKIKVFKTMEDAYGPRIHHIKIYYYFIGEMVVSQEFMDDEKTCANNTSL